MSGVLERARNNAPYLFWVVGVAWLGVGILAGSALVAWPVAACVLSGLFLRMWPGTRLTWAWAISSAVMGLIISAYQVYAWAPFIGGAFSTLATEALGGFAILGLVHVFLIYAGGYGPRGPKQATS